MAMCSYLLINDIKSFFPLESSLSYYQVIINPNFLIIIMFYISIYYCIYHGIRKYNKWSEMMDRLKELDQNIRKEISMNDQSIKIVETLAIFMTFTCPFLGIIINFLYNRLLYRIIEKLITEIIINYIILAQFLIKNFVFDVVVYVLYCRFQTVNKLIGQLDKLSDMQCIAFKIRSVREFHAGICDVANMVNDIYGLYLLFCSADCFFIAMTGLINFYLARNDNDLLLLIYAVIPIVLSMQFCLICWICTLACEESNRTGRIIHKIILNCKPVNLHKHDVSNQSSLEVRFSQEDSNGEQYSHCGSSHNTYVVENFLRRSLDQECVTKEVNEFSIQLQQMRVAFTACNFFEINNSSYGCFVGVIVTYIITILKLYPIPISEEYYKDI
ncbi:uncharacterized protein LOC120357894 isoform X1 [Solenopsis invicta]|uniref:uncharacterized protein LOC120357894 isoform X1 n=1 Tax=Solenopsis invicta TaxID=13686 RepID=UPI00193E4D9B|nr:uncharacterized protein LOC120357894 isoform X1 [Solenopsis invicta]